MSVADERSALAPLPSLFHLARRLYQAYPDGPLPDGGVWPGILDVGSAERQQALTALLRDFFADLALSAQDLHDRCTQLAFYDHDVSACERCLPFAALKNSQNGCEAIPATSGSRAVE